MDTGDCNGSANLCTADIPIPHGPCDATLFPQGPFSPSLEHLKDTLKQNLFFQQKRTAIASHGGYT